MWKSCILSICFTILSGATQVNLLSGNFFFHFIIDKLLTQLGDVQIECHSNRLFTEAIAFADDFML